MSQRINKIIIGKLNDNEDYIDVDLLENNSSDVIDSIFDILNDEIPEDYKGNKNFKRLDYLFEQLNCVITNGDDINRNLIRRKLYKLIEKIERIQLERKKYFLDYDQEMEQLNGLIIKLNEIIEVVDTKENKKYDFVTQLIDEQKIEYLELTFDKYPGFVNLRNKDETPLFRTIVCKFLDNASNLNENNLLFYSNLLSLMKNQKTFNLSDSEKRKCLDEISKTINKMSYNKKTKKKNQKGLEWINTLVLIVEPDLMKKDGNKNNIDILSSKYEVPIDFDEDIIDDVESIEIPIDVSKYKDREKIDDYIITIDKENAIEIDDGLSCRKLDNGNYLLGVHTASILGYFNYNSDIVKEAINRIHSIYLSKKYQDKDNDFNRVIPLFPFKFSSDIASLLPGEDRLSRSFYFEIDNKGNIVNKRFIKSIVNSSKKTTYNDINKILEEGTINDNLNNTVTNLKEVTKILENKYKMPFMYKELNNDIAFNFNEQDIVAEKMVYYSMLLTGNEVANFFAENNYPCLYRTLEIEDNRNDQLNEMIKNLTSTYGGRVYDKLYQLVSGLYPKAKYGISGSHDGIGLDHYCHCTSALRRSADIIVEHSLETCYDKEPTPEELVDLEDEILQVATLINEKSKKIEWFTNEQKQLKKR